MSLLKGDFDVKLPAINDLFYVYVGFTHVSGILEYGLKDYVQYANDPLLYKRTIERAIRPLQTTYDSDYTAQRAAEVLLKWTKQKNPNIQIHTCGPTEGSRRIWLQAKVCDIWRDMIYVNLIRRCNVPETYD